jgi:hypothetical protein
MIDKEYILCFSFHWPHDRFALGWDWMRPDEKYDYHAIKIYLLICTIDVNI